MDERIDASIHFLLLIGALSVFFIRYRRLGFYLRLVGFYLVATFVFDVLAAYIMFSKGLGGRVPNNLFVYHILTPIQYVFIALIFIDRITNPAVRKSIRISIPAFLFISILISATIQPLDDYNTYALLLKYILTIFWILLLLRQMLNSLSTASLEKDPIFWICTGLLFHSMGNILVEGVANYLINNFHDYFEKIYAIYSLLNYFLFISFAIAFLTKKGSSYSTV